MTAKLFATLTLIISLLFQNIAVLPARHPQDVRLKAVLLADIHTDGNPIRDRNDLLREGFASVGRTQRDADTLVMCGDITNCGEWTEYVNLLAYLNVYCRIRDRMPEMGNHDSWNHDDDPDYAKAERYFKAFCRWNGVKTDKVYYQKTVNGVPFLVMGVEAADLGDPYHSAEQMDWLEAELNAAVAAGQPVFVICHKPLAAMGADAARMEQILTAAAENAAAPIVYVSGHWHALGGNTFSRPLDKLVYLNLPSFLDNDGAPGFIAELTEHTLTLTGYSFLREEPLEGFEYHVAF
ncbi:MAG: metallophosphoesterase [Clostridia bacterium]|nr:metallophosphoesterase [Clostridia bacterium]